MSYSHALDNQMRAARVWASERGAYTAMQQYKTIHDRGRPSPSPDRIMERNILDIRRSDVFYVAPDIGEMLERSAGSMPPGTTLTPECIPTDAGFVYLPRPITLAHPDADQGIPIWGISWARYANDGTLGARYGLLDTVSSGVAIHWYGDYQGGDAPVSSCEWPYGEPWDNWTARADGISDQERTQDTWKKSGFSRSFVMAFCAFVSQRILVSQPQRPDRATRKRTAGTWQHEALIRVVQLRRSVAQEAAREAGSDPVEWSCSWIVRGHWRQQACGANLSERRPVFVLPHVKGPDDKPLKAPADRVFAVVR